MSKTMRWTWMMMAVLIGCGGGCTRKSSGPATPPAQVIQENTALPSDGPPDLSILAKRHPVQP